MIIIFFFLIFFFLPVYKMHPRLSIFLLAATNCVLYTEIYGKWFEHATAWQDIIVHLPLHTLERNGGPSRMVKAIIIVNTICRHGRDQIMLMDWNGETGNKSKNPGNINICEVIRAVILYNLAIANSILKCSNHLTKNKLCIFCRYNILYKINLKKNLSCIL